ncbi:hypothetical protein AB5I41_18840 [Sphingomonas sp. MMS24-JH45]
MPRFLLATATPEGGAHAIAAIALVGGRVAARVDLDAAAEACTGFDGTIVLDLVGGEEAAVDAAVAAVSTAAAAHGVPLVIAMTLEQVDTVFYAVVGTDAELLCEPDQTQWVRALLTAGSIAGATGVREPGDEGGAACPAARRGGADRRSAGAAGRRGASACRRGRSPPGVRRPACRPDDHRCRGSRPDPRAAAA